MLGFWQVDRGQEKSMLYDDYVKKSSLPPKLIVDSTDSVTQYTKVKLKGQFNNERQFLLDNKINNKKAYFKHNLSASPTRSSMTSSDQIGRLNSGQSKTQKFLYNKIGYDFDKLEYKIIQVAIFKPEILILEIDLIFF